MAAVAEAPKRRRLPPEVNQILFVKNLPFKITNDDMYNIFGKYGSLRQIRIGSEKGTFGTAFVVYDDIYDAKAAVDHLSGFNVQGRYLVVLYYNRKAMKKNFSATLANNKEQID